MVNSLTIFQNEIIKWLNCDNCLSKLSNMPWTYDSWTSDVVWNIVLGPELLNVVDVGWVEPGNIVKSTCVEWGLLWTPKLPLVTGIYYNIDSQTYTSKKNKRHIFITLNKIHPIYTSNSKETRLCQSVCWWCRWPNNSSKQIRPKAGKKYLQSKDKESTKWGVVIVWEAMIAGLHLIHSIPTTIHSLNHLIPQVMPM